MNVSRTNRLNDEAGRLAALHRYEILDCGPEQEITDLVTLTRLVLETPFAAVTMIDQERQWMVAVSGVAPIECDRRDAFCDHTIRGTAPLIVPDARRDPRFFGNPFVVGAPGVTSYMGAPLTSPDGYNIGTLCVFDTQSRLFKPRQVDLLEHFARVVMSMLELRLLARVDALTGVLTRRAFTDRLDRAVAEGGQHCILLIDLDNFKMVNDGHGHRVGDDVLRRTADTIQSMIRKSDAIGRLGGEEFGLLLTDMPLSEAWETAERVRRAVSGTPLASLAGHAPTVSIGLAELRAGEGRAAWLERADGALYCAKRGGRDRCVAADELPGQI